MSMKPGAMRRRPPSHIVKLHDSLEPFPLTYPFHIDKFDIRENAGIELLPHLVVINLIEEGFANYTMRRNFVFRIVPLERFFGARNLRFCLRNATELNAIVPIRFLALNL